jgi:hypothetical protein
MFIYSVSCLDIWFDEHFHFIIVSSSIGHLQGLDHS